jgi:hypothetical protein
MLQMFGVIADTVGKRVFSSLDLLGAFYADDVNDGMMGNVSLDLPPLPLLPSRQCNPPTRGLKDCIQDQPVAA